MLHNALFIAAKDIRYTLREKSTLLWLFVMPVVFFYFIGTATSGMGGGAAPDRLTVVAPADAGFLADRLVDRLSRDGYQVTRVEPTGADAGALDDAGGRRLWLPPRLTAGALAGEPQTLRFRGVDSPLGADLDQVRINRVVYTVLADVVAAAAAGGVDEAALAALDAMPRKLTLAVAAGGQRQRIPTGFEQAVPGILVMFTLLVLLTSGAVLLVAEREQGMLRRLAVAPLSRAEIVLGKLSGKLALGLIQVGFALLAGTVLFGMEWGPDLWMVLVVLVAWAALCGSLGLLIGCLGSSQGQVAGFGVLSANLLAGLGGCWWPIEITPGWMQALQKLLPTGWTMDALHKLISFGDGPASVLPHLGALLAATILAAWYASRRFRYE